jgi:hypothetical protein
MNTYSIVDALMGFIREFLKTPVLDLVPSDLMGYKL